MIDEFSLDGTGWAQFSDDKTRRYRLGRILNPSIAGGGWHGLPKSMDRTVFLMLNPSTADAFRLDPTVRKCCQFASRWGSDVLEVVNLFAFRSPNPADLLTAIPRGTLEEDDAIIAACTQLGRTITIASWGNHGALDGRAEWVRRQLAERHIKIWHLGTTQHGQPLHPLARGKSFIPLDREPQAWA